MQASTTDALIEQAVRPIWLRSKTPAAPAATREIEEDWGKRKWR
jgi:hypothetical protein